MQSNVVIVLDVCYLPKDCCVEVLSITVTGVLPRLMSKISVTGLVWQQHNTKMWLRFTLSSLICLGNTLGLTSNVTQRTTFNRVLCASKHTRVLYVTNVIYISLKVFVSVRARKYLNDFTRYQKMVNVF